MVNQQHLPPQPPPPPQMVANQSYGQWTLPPLPSRGMAAAPPLPPVIMNPMKFPNPMFVGRSKQPGRSGSNSNWKGKKPMDKRGVGGLGYQPPTLFELEQQNRVKARRFYHPKKKFNRMGPYAHAPRNTTSYIIRAKKSGGIASLVSPCPVTPAVLPTPVFSPSREALVDMAKEEWGVDGYGSMKGLIRLRSPGNDENVDDYDEEDDEGGSSESDVEEHVEVERRLDHDLSRFEMIYPNSSGVDHHNLLENRVDDQDTHIAQLEEENLVLKERLYLMEREFGEMRRRLLCLERQNQVVEDINEEVVENVSENDSGGRLGNFSLLVNRNDEEVDFVPRDGETGARRDNTNSDEMMHKDGLERNMCKDGLLDDGLGFVLTVANKGVEHDKLTGDLSEKSSEKCESMENKDLGSVNGTKLDIVDDVKGQTVGDVNMGENVPDEVNDNNRAASVVNNVSSEVILKKEDETMVFETQAEDIGNTINDKVAGDVCMGDMLSADKAVGDHKSDG